VPQAIEETLHEQLLPATEFSWRRYHQERIDGQRVDAAHTPRRGASLAA
jgi:hypothetical protein